MSALEKVDALIAFVTGAGTSQDQHISCNGMRELNALLSTVQTQRFFLLFCGNTVNGKSWCPDCVASQPVIEENVKYLNPATDALITVYVGEKAEWKNKDNVFRTDSRFKLTGVPTLLMYGTQKRLVEPQCCDSSLVQMLFENDDAE